MNKGLLELATYLNISDEQATISYDGINSSIIFGLLYNIPYNKVYIMTNITGSFIGYTHIKKQTDNCIYLSSNTTDWYKVGTDGTITTSGGCIISIRTFDFINSNLKINGVNTFANEYSTINPSITVTGNYTVVPNIKTVNVNASTATIDLTNMIVTDSITIRKLSTYNGSAITVSPPSGATFEGKSSISLYGQYSFVEIERISATVFAIKDLKDEFNVVVTERDVNVSRTSISKMIYRFITGVPAAAVSGASIVLPIYDNITTINNIQLTQESFAGEYYTIYVYIGDWETSKSITISKKEATTYGHSVYCEVILSK